MLIYVPLNQIDDNPFQKRSDYGDIEDLAARIAAAYDSYPDTLGLMQVPRGRVVFRTQADEHYLSNHEVAHKVDDAGVLWRDQALRVELAFGHRRLRAFQHLKGRGAPGYESGFFPVHVDLLTDEQLLDAVWSENRERKDISPVEEAELLQVKIERLGSQAAAAQAWGLARSTVANRLRLLGMPEEVQNANRRGLLSERQCLALEPILRIDGLVNGRVSWGNAIGSGWATPAGGTAVVELALKQPESVTSDVLREHRKAMITYAGEDLPEWLAVANFDGVKGVEQPQCKGCPYRIDQSCLQPDCRTVKLEAYADMALEAFSAETGIPISDRDEDFPERHEDKKRLMELYQAGETGDGMVCAWRLDVSQARPFASYMHVTYVDKQDDGRAGIVLGYRGRIPQAEETAAQSPYEMPTQEEIDDWIKGSDTIVATARRRVMTALSDELLRMADTAVLDILQALIYGPGDEWREDAALAKGAVTWLAQKGSGLSSWFYNDLQMVKALQALAKRANIDVKVLGDERAEMEATAVLILGLWYVSHDVYYWWKERAVECAQWIAAWQERAKKTPPPAELVAAMERAQRHIEQKLADAAEE